MYLFKMAWRNLGRNPGRTVLSLLAVIAGVSAILLTRGYVDGIVDNMLNSSINLNSGHVRLIRPEYEVKERLLSLGYPLGEQGKPYSRLIGEIRRQPGVEQAAGRIRFGLLLVAGEDRQEAVMGLGIEPEAEDRATHLSRYLRGRGEGRLPRMGRQEIVLGGRLLSKLGLRVGDKVNAVFSTSFGSFKIATFAVVGRLESGLRYLDESLAYLPLDTAMNLLDLEDAVTEIVVFGRDVGQTGALQRTLQSYLKVSGLKIKAVPWYQFNEMIAYVNKAKGIYLLIYLLIAFLASFVVFNTLMMVVAERTREIGMLTALGLAPGQTKQLFLWEGANVAVLGSLIGAALGGVGNWLLSRIGFDLTKMMNAFGKELLMPSVVYSKFNLFDILFSFVLGVAVTMVACYLPARRAALLKPTEALRTI